MTWSFLIKNGDLSLSGPGGMATTTGQNKMVQDLKHWLLEPRGSDPLHPEWGSALDGGQLSDGTVLPSSIGGMFTAEDKLTIEAEVRRVLAAYQLQQAQRLGRETIQFAGKNTFSRGEILRSIDQVRVQQIGDTALVTVSLIAADGTQLTFTQPLGA